MLKGKVAVVTGASRGIGKAIAIELAKAGADIAIIYAGNTKAAEETADEIKALGKNVKTYQCNVADFSKSAEMVTQIIEELGGVDILVNNAGIVKDGLVLSMKESDFDNVIDINLKGSFNMIKHIYSHMMRKRAGRIINITSVSGLSGNAGQANYAASKAGMVGLTKSVAKELAGRGITCNAIAPGYIATDMTASLNDKVIEQAQNMIPLKRLGKPEDIAHMAVFLASDMASYITGEVIKVDGGLTM